MCSVPFIQPLVRSITLCFSLAVAVELSQAQSIIIDGSLVPQQTLTGPNYQVGASLGHQVAGNRFHSYSELSLLTGESLRFIELTGVNNLINRVTGLGKVSNLDGPISTEISGVNLFLLNPNGVIFGPNASLNVGGAFRVATADFVRMGDGAQFFANLTDTSTLSSAPVVAFGFLAGNPTGITVAGSSLEVPVGQTLTLVAGDLSIHGPGSSAAPTLQARSGRIELVSVASPGEVPLVPVGATPAFSTGGFTTLGSITLTNGARVAVPAAIGNATPGGEMIIRAGRLTLDQASTFIASTGGNVSAPPVAFDAQVRGAVVLDNGSTIGATNTGPTSTGNAGAVQLMAGSVEIKNNAAINTFYFGHGDASDVSIQADSIRLTGGGGIFGENLGANNQGSGGTIDLRATQEIFIGPGSRIQTKNFQGIGNGSEILLSSPQVVVEGATGLAAGISGFTGGNGTASSVTINVGTLDIRGQEALIDTRAQSVAVGAGNPPTLGGGPIIVRGQGGAGTFADLVRVSGLGSGLNSETSGQGAGGDMGFNAARMTLADQAQVSSKTTGAGQAGTITLNVGSLDVGGGARIVGNTTGSGAGGTLNVNATGAVLVSGTGSGLFSDAEASGRGGDITMQGSSVAVNSGAKVSASSSGSSDAGSIIITTPGLFTSTGGAVTTTAVSGRGGDIHITAGEVNLLGAIISASSLGAGNAGSITIDSGLRFLSTNSAVTTRADEASGGDITVIAQDMIRLVNSQINTSVAGGTATQGGNIMIDPQFVVLQNSQIVAQAFAGTGGNITIVASQFLSDPASLVDASSQLGVSGTVNIRAPISNLDGDIAALPENVTEVASLLQSSCLARMKGGQISSLIQRGRDEVPAEPGGPVVLPLFASATFPALSTQHSALSTSAPHGLVAGAGEFRIGGLSRLMAETGMKGACRAS